MKREQKIAHLADEFSTDALGELLLIIFKYRWYMVIV